MAVGFVACVFRDVTQKILDRLESRRVVTVVVVIVIGVQE